MEHSTLAEDSDVAAERVRLKDVPLETLRPQNSVLMVDLTKRYGSFLAVDGLSVGVTPGECFGLAGINGAGKTSTFMMLTRDATISGGEAYMKGLSVKTQLRQVGKLLQLCIGLKTCAALHRFETFCSFAHF